MIPVKGDMKSSTIRVFLGVLVFVLILADWTSSSSDSNAVIHSVDENVDEADQLHLKQTSQGQFVQLASIDKYNKSPTENFEGLQRLKKHGRENGGVEKHYRQAYKSDGSCGYSQLSHFSCYKGIRYRCDPYVKRCTRNYGGSNLWHEFRDDSQCGLTRNDKQKGNPVDCKTDTDCYKFWRGLESRRPGDMPCTEQWEKYPCQRGIRYGCSYRYSWLSIGKGTCWHESETGAVKWTSVGCKKTWPYYKCMPFGSDHVMDNHVTFVCNEGALKNGNVECWRRCGSKGGASSFCGGHSCCRKGWKDGTGCNGSNGCSGNHCCVEKPAGGK